MSYLDSFLTLTGDQQRLCDDVTDLAGIDGSDCKTHLDAATAPAGDKAAVADWLGGPEAAAEYRGLHRRDTDTDTDGM